MTSLQNTRVEFRRLGIVEVDEFSNTPKSSHWFIVVNTNKTARNANELDILKSKLEDTIATLFDKENFNETFEIKKRNTTIDKVIITTSIEIGSKFKRVHANIQVDVFHDGAIHLRYRKFIENFNSIMRLNTRLHINIQKVTSPDAVRNYISKGTRRQDLPDDVITSTDLPDPPTVSIPSPPRAVASKSKVPAPPRRVTIVNSARPRTTEEQRLVDWFKWRQQLGETLNPGRNITTTKLRPDRR
jgi:hypothetical protein